VKSNSENIRNYAHGANFTYIVKTFSLLKNVSKKLRLHLY